MPAATIITLSLSPEVAADEFQVRAAALAEGGFPPQSTHSIRVLKRSIDARSRSGVKMILQVAVGPEQDLTPTPFDPELQTVSSNERPVVIVGAGPAGLFAALRLLQLGIRPIIIERGKDVRARRRDLAQLTRNAVVNPDSNYCFGEGGAGTYSDGKLYTRSNKRGSIERILSLFIHFGADPRIGVDAHPHIGTNKLPAIIAAMREAILNCGGEVLFEKRMTDIRLTANAVSGIVLQDGTQIDCRQLILATGHSARDIFRMLHQNNILIEAKPYALGVRIEHPQSIIDQVQYHCNSRGEYLPPASYSLVSQEGGRGVFSFCMCPGGIIAPASTAPGEVVVNGWSPSRRNNPFANSGTVVAVDEHDFARYGFTGPLAGMDYQQMVEQQCFTAAGSNLTAPAQRLTDFASGKVSATLPDCSYTPGITPVSMAEVLPKEVHDALRSAVGTFGKKMKGYYTQEAVLVATESRTSSPVRIPRDKDSLEHPQIRGLFPCAEGAGYAGGIVSAAMDGERCAEAAARVYKR
ncbi:MAG: FAD-binding protein [Sphingobacteriales bacterium]|nr:MAG: FAD-binding protein [Sphingobacteriales bacterium]